MWFLATAGVSCSGAKDNFSEKSDVIIKYSIAAPQGLFLVGAFDAQASSPIQPIWGGNDVSDLICVDSEAVLIPHMILLDEDWSVQLASEAGDL